MEQIYEKPADSKIFFISVFASLSNFRSIEVKVEVEVEAEAKVELEVEVERPLTLALLFNPSS